MAGERLAKLINDAKTPNHEMTDIVFGEVVSTSPLRVRVENRFTVERNFLILSQMVRDLTVRISIPTISASSGQVNSVQLNGNQPDVDRDVQRVSVVTNISTGTQEQEIQIFRALRVGDRVRMIRGHKSQLFYVLERG